MVTMSAGAGGGGGGGGGDGNGLTPSPPNSSLVVLVVEGSAVNGAYINEMKTNYIVPALEYFHGGSLEDSNQGVTNSGAMGGGLWETNALYGCVVAGSADWLPAPPVSALGPFVHPQQLINALDAIPLVGGRGESHACLAEGLHTAAACLDELATTRTSIDSNEHNNVSRYVILACSNPPYLSAAGGCTVLGGPTGGADEAAAMLGAAGIRLSIVAPRKIPALLRLFECAGGDLSQAQARNYAKDPRHLVLVRGFALKERPPSPAVTVPPVVPSSAAPVTATVPTVVSPMMSEDITNSQQQMYRPPGPQQPLQAGLLVGARGRGAGSGPVGGASISGGPTGQAGAVVPGQVGTTQVGPTQVGPGQVGPSVPIGQQSGQMRWLNPTQAAGQRATTPQAPFQHPAPSALLTQLAQPPYPQARPVQPQQGTSQPMVSGTQGIGGPASSTAPVTGATLSAPNLPSGGAVPSQGGSQQQVATAATPQRSFIWQGVLEWIEKGKGPSDQQKLKRHLPCQVSASSREFEPELRADTWPPKLIMQLMPKQLIGTIGGHHLKDSKSVLFHPQQNEALESLTKVMGGGYAGCVHFPQSTTPCDIKVLILLYAAEKKTYLGFIPNNQVTFVDRLRKVIEQSKLSQIISKQQGVPVSGVSGIQGAVQGVQGVQAVQGGQTVQQGMQNVQGSQNNSGGGQQRPLDHLEAARQQNLEKIMQLQQTLEAAQQQEAQFKTQLELEAQYKTQMELVMSSQSHMHQQHQQQQAEMMQLDQHYKQVEDARKQLSQLQQMSGGGVGNLAAAGGGMGGAGVGVRLPGGPMQSNLGMGPGGASMGGQGMGGPGMGPGVTALGPGSMGPVGPGAGMAVGPGTSIGPGGPPLGPPQSHMMAAQQQQGPGARMMRPGLGGNPGLRHLLQQQPQYGHGRGAGGRPQNYPQEDPAPPYQDFI